LCYKNITKLNNDVTAKIWTLISAVQAPVDTIELVVELAATVELKVVVDELIFEPELELVTKRVEAELELVTVSIVELLLDVDAAVDVGVAIDVDVDTVPEVEVAVELVELEDVVKDG